MINKELIGKALFSASISGLAFISLFLIFKYLPPVISYVLILLILAFVGLSLIGND